jgi:hypothetical protein
MSALARFILYACYLFVFLFLEQKINKWWPGLGGYWGPAVPDCELSRRTVLPPAVVARP